MKRNGDKWGVMEELFSGIFFLAGITVIFFGVVMRYFFNKPSIWVDEFSVYLIIWGTVLGWSTAQRDGKHIRVSMLYDRLSLKHQRVLSIFSNCVGILFSVFLAYAAYVLEVTYIQTGLRSVNTAFPLWIVYIFFPVAALLLGIRYAQELVFLLKNKGKDWVKAHEIQPQKLSEEL